MRSPRSAVVALLLALGFAAFYAGVSRGVFVFGDDILMYQVTEAIVERGEVSVTSPARRGDVARSILGREGDRFAKYGIGQSLAAIPFYAAARRFERFRLADTVDRFGNLRNGHRVFSTGLTNAVTGGGAVALTFLLAVEVGFGPLVAFALAISLGLGTLLPHYASTFLSEPLSAACLALGVFALARADRRARAASSGWEGGRWLATSGFACGLLVATKVAHLLIVAPFAVWVLVIAWRARRRGWAHLVAWSLPFAAWLSAISVYNWARFGGALATGYGKEGRDFSSPLLEGLSGLLISPAKGVFWYCPVLLLAVAGARRFAVRRPALALATAAASLLHVIAMAKYYQWPGGDCWGPRFLVPLLPLWVLPAGEVFSRWRESGILSRLVVVLVLVATLVVGLTPLLVPFDGFADRMTGHRARIAAELWRFDESPLVRHLERLPEAFGVTLRKLSGAVGLRARPVGPEALSVPDWAFVRYDSYRLLIWSRRCLAAAFALLLAAAWMARRAQKALLSRPPQ